MKKFFSAMLLAALCASTQISAATYPGEHRGFYFSQNLAFAYTSIDQTTKYNRSFGSEKEILLFSGPLFYSESRIGISIANFASIYALLGGGYASGSYSEETKYSVKDPESNSDKDYENKYFEDNASSDTRYVFGIGGEFTPSGTTATFSMDFSSGQAWASWLTISAISKKKTMKKQHLHPSSTPLYD